MFYGSFGWDEGWYLIACQKVYQGKFLYRDFGYTQTPLFPYVYGFLLKVFGTHLLTARLISFILSLVSVWLVLRISLQIGSNQSAVLACWLISCSPVIVFFLTIVSPHTLSTVFILLSIYFFLKKNTLLRRMLSLSFMVLAIGSRLTVFPGWLVLIAFLWMENKFTKKFFIPVLVSSFIGIIVFMPFVLVCKNAFLFHAVLYHLQWAPSLSKLFITKMLFLYYLEESSSILLILGVITTLIYLKKDYFRRLQANTWLVISMCIVLGLFQASLKRAATIYIVNMLILAAIVVSIGLQRILSDIQNKSIVKTFYIIFIISLLLYGTIYPFKYFLNYRNYENQKYYDPQYISEISQYIQANTLPNSKILTLDTIIAIESKRDVFPGTEMSLFAYYPDWPDEKTQQLQLLNRNRLFQYIESTTASAVVISEESFDGNYATGEKNLEDETKRVSDKVKEYYHLVKTYPEYISSSPHGSLYIYFPNTSNKDTN